ncbi:YhdP family protein [Magnetococcus sp. PR-3]|uniref:YhdP family protein n=1 Tax=Magnetococcus sp. PR-3 TaxID=3120355 RepID=UPI002FCE2056
MLRKVVKWSIGLLLGLPALLVALLLLWFAVAPPEIDALRDQIEQEVEARLGIPVHIAGMKLKTSSSLLDLHLEGVTLYDAPRSRPLVRIDDLRVRLKPWNIKELLHGRIPLEIFILNGDTFAVKHDRTHEWSIAGQTLPQWQAQFQPSQLVATPAVKPAKLHPLIQPLAEYGQDLLARLEVATVRLTNLSLAILHMPKPNTPLQAVGRLNLINAQLQNRVGSSPLNWTMRGDFMPRWGAEKGDNPITYQLQGALQKRGRWHLSGKVDHVQPSRWHHLLGPSGKTLAGMQFPISVDFRVHGGGDEPWKSSWYAKLDKGQWDTQGLFRWPIPITSLTAKGQAIEDKDPAKGWLLDIKQFDFRNRHGRAQGKVKMTHMGLSSSPYIDLTATAGGIDTKEARYFYPPEHMHPSLVEWLDTALLDGYIPHADVRIKGRTYDIPFVPNGSRKANGTFLVKAKVKKLDLAYFPQLPPIHDADVDLTFANEKMTAHVKGGSLGKSKNVRGSAIIPDILNGDQTLIVDAKVDGHMRSIWQDVIQNPHLKWGDHVGLEGADFEGKGLFSLKMKLPLNHSIDVRYDTQLDFHQASAHLPFLNQPIEQTSGILRVDNDLLDLNVHQAIFDGLPVDGTIKAADYAVDGQSDLQMSFHSTLQGKRLKDRLQPFLEKPPALQGPVDLQVTLQRPSGREVYASEVKLDLSRMQIPNYKGLEKKETDPGIISFKGDFHPQRLSIDLQKLNIKLGNLTAHGHGFWQQGKDETQIILKDLQLGNSQGHIHFRQGGLDPQAAAYRLEGTFSTLDLTHWQSRNHKTVVNNKEKTPFKMVWKPEKLRHIPQRPSIVILKADQVQLANDIRAQNLQLKARLDAKNLHIDSGEFFIDDKAVNVAGQLSWQNRVGEGAYQGILDFRSDDLGRVLAGANIHDGMSGGKGVFQLKLDGQASPNQSLISSLSGTGSLTVEKGSIKQLRLLSNILSLLSVQELPRLLFGKRPDLKREGFYFDKLAGSFKLDQGKWHSDKVEVTGPSMKMVISGDMNLTSQKMELLVGVRPLQSLDAIISSVPVLGQLLAGGREALLETQFSVAGEMEDPKILLKPISALAPGIVRDILQASGKALSGGASKKTDQPTENVPQKLQTPINSGPSTAPLTGDAP